MAQPAKPIPVTLVSATLATYCWILIAVFGALPDRFGRPRVEQELVGQEDPRESTDPAG